MTRADPLGQLQPKFSGIHHPILGWFALVVAGVLQAASLAWPISMPNVFSLIGLTQGQPVWWAQIVAMVVLAYALMVSATPRQAAWRGWWFALAWLAGTFAWLFTSMHTYGGLPAVLAVLAVGLLAGALGLYHAAASWCFCALAQRNKAFFAMYFVAFWGLAELARGLLLTGFGWGAVGYAHVDGPLAPLLPWVGVYGVGAVAAALAVGLARMLQAARWPLAARQAAVWLVGWGLLQALPAQIGADAGKLEVTLLQGNIAQEEKFDFALGVPRALRWYGSALAASTSSLVITPETALPVLPEQLPPGYWDALQQRFAHGDQAALVGMPLGDEALGYTNSVVGLRPGQVTPWRYDKHHLVPFGEFIPPMARWFTRLMNIPLGDFNRGALPQPTFDWQGQRLATSVCFENLFSEELAVPFAWPDTAPTVLVNISNMGWFGEHLAMDQHLHIARTRAREFARPFVLATNTGRSGVVDHLGQLTHALPNHMAQTLQAQVQGRTGITPYAHWVSRWGQWPLVALAVLALSLGHIGQWLKRRTKP